MKRLYLLRHAKAVAAGHGLRDEDRVLAERGRADAVRIGQFLGEEGYRPDVVLCSPSARTRETFDLILPRLAARPHILHPRELYLARAATLFDAVLQTRDAAGSVMIVAHSPGIEECALALARAPAERKRRRQHQAMAEKFPTGALAVIDFEASHWRAVAPGEGELVLFIRPGDLRGE